MFMNLEGGDARQTSGNCALAFFPFFQSFFPERIAERTVIIHLFGFRQILAADGNREENENQKNCSCKISHSLILLDNSSNIHNAIYFEKTKCQGEKNKC